MKCTNIGQTVYFELTYNGRVFKEILCIAVNETTAELIVKTMNFTQQYIKD